MRIAVIVAHPDDETIWAGGLILRHRQWEWTILSLCRADDEDRCPKFFHVCRHLGARGLISDLDDGQPLARIDGPRDIGRRIAGQLPNDQPWDLVLTHGPQGEYGHLRHRQISAEVERLIRIGRLATGQFWTFACLCSPQPGDCRPDPQAEIRLELSPAELAEKQRIIREDYGYAADSFEVRACIGVESFRGPAGARSVIHEDPGAVRLSSIPRGPGDAG